MTVTLSLAAFFATFFPMLAVGVGLGIWAARRRVEPKREVDLRKTLDGAKDANVAKLLEQCRKDNI
jgi:hypothetical protein